MKLSKTLWMIYKIVYYTTLIILCFICAYYLIQFLGACAIFGTTETCNLCIKALRMMSQDSGASYEYLNVLFFIIYEPLIIILLTIISIIALHTNNKIYKEVLKLILLILLITGAGCLVLLGLYFLKLI